ncbi:MAG: mismatch-specific DNA-glycosylase [Acidimicrobiia bacterium]|nr:mismatch-specific DNA-glycosylase [Acidimicrobiia bacterium]
MLRLRSVSLVRLPVALARVHWSTAPGEVVEWQLPESADSRRLDDIVAGAGFEWCGRGPGGGRPAGGRRARRLRTLPDTVGPGMRLLVCGLNPSVVAADAGFGFAGATNRFWPAALEAGLVSRARDPLHGLLADGVGMTDLVKRATRGTADLTAAEYRAGAERVQRLVRWLHPRVVLFVGLEGWRAALDRRARPGVQPTGFGGARAYVMPSTSGLNAHARLGDLVAHIRAAAERTTGLGR